MRVNADVSFVHLVYPFVYDAGRFGDRIAALAGAKTPGKCDWPIWHADRFPEEDLLPQVSAYLNPADDRIPTARLWRLDSTQTHAYGLAGTADWCLNPPRHRISFRVGPKRGSGFAAQLALFQDGVGFLTLRADPVSQEVGDWLDFAHYSRFVRGQRDVCVELRRRAKGPDTHTPHLEPFFPEAAGGSAAHPDGRGRLMEILATLLMTGSLDGESGPWWREIFVPGQVLPFAGLFVGDIDASSIPKLTYRLRNFFHANQDIRPTEEDLRADHPSLLPYAEGQWFVFSLDGGAFLACDAPDTPFYRTTLPEHLRTSYFLLFLLALHQRFALMSLSEQVAERWLDCSDDPCEEQREAAFRRIRDSLFSFTARAHFVQVMQREHHHRCYRKWLEVFQIPELFQEVRGEVQDMHDFLIMQRADRQAERDRDARERAGRLEGLLTAIAAVFGVPALILACLQAAGGADLGTALLVAVASMILGGLLYLGVRRMAGRAK